MQIAWFTDAQAPYREPLFSATGAAERADGALPLRRGAEQRHFRYRPHAGYPSALVPAGSSRAPVPWRVSTRTRRSCGPVPRDPSWTPT